MPKFKTENPGTWFYFNPDDESAGGVCLRELSTDEHDQIERLTVRKKRKFKHGVSYDDEQVDEKLASKLRWDYCIIGWQEIYLDDHPLECTTENKVKMMKVIDFVKFIVDALNELVDTNKSLEEARVKNSQSSSNGKSKSQNAPLAKVSTETKV